MAPDEGSADGEAGGKGGRAATAQPTPIPRAPARPAPSATPEPSPTRPPVPDLSAPEGSAEREAAEGAAGTPSERIFGINFNSALYGCQAAFAAMKDSGGGSIINVSSTGIDVPHFGNGLYAATKAAVAMMTMCLAAEFGPFGVRVNAVAPGATLTRFSERHLYDADGHRDEQDQDRCDDVG